MKKIVTAMIAIAALLCMVNVHALAQETETPETQFARLQTIFDSGPSAAQQAAAAIYMAAPTAKFKIEATGDGVAAGPTYAMTFPGKPLQITITGAVGVCKFVNTFTGEQWSSTASRTFTPTLNENEATLLTGGYIAGECDGPSGRMTSTLFIHLFNKFGAISVMEADDVAGPINTVRRLYGVGPAQSPIFSWNAPTGSPASGQTDAFGAFSTSFTTGGVKIVEGVFGPEPARAGKAFSTRFAFFSIGNPALSIGRDAMAITLGASEEANIPPGLLTLEVRYARRIDRIPVEIEGVPAGEKVRLDLPSELRGMTIIATYVTTGDDSLWWGRRLPAMRQNLPERQ